ncbi:hypothetical protein, partial [Aeromonas caviae]|uniref:hypothetical protein n=1 Tax=Aeromonas caviae TaxID=648 RepID=UPI002B465280
MSSRKWCREAVSGCRGGPESLLGGGCGWLVTSQPGTSSVVLDIHQLEGDDRLGAVLDPEFAEGGVIWALMVARGSTVLDIHLLEGDDRLGAVLDPEFAEGGVIWALMMARGSTVLDIHLLEGDDRL